MPEGPSSLISIEGIRALGRHGANPGERLEAQEFLVDVDVWVTTTADSLEGTLDYRTVVQIARKTIESDSFVLLETLAEAVATALLDAGPVVRATAVVHKPDAARSMGVADVSAEVTLDLEE
jgi:7,8-dihydroneopterin aldolase/epimerase/oxygenase